MKNLWAKTRPVSNPYVVVSSNGWTYKILKAYQTRAKEKVNPYARVFCMVVSPVCPEGEMGDTYLTDIPMTRAFRDALEAREKNEAKD